MVFSCTLLHIDPSAILRVTRAVDEMKFYGRYRRLVIKIKRF